MTSLRSFLFDKRLAFLLLAALLAGCASRPYPYFAKSGTNVWATGCASKVLQGKQSLSVVAPCKKLSLISYVIAIGKGKKHDIYGGIVPKNQVFKKIISGTIGDWSWELTGTPPIVRQWRSPSPASAAPGASSARAQQVSWPRMYSTLYSVYRYVLATPPPPSHFVINFFPYNQSISRTVTTSTASGIIMPFYAPYYGGLIQAQPQSPLLPKAKQTTKGWTYTYLTNQVGMITYYSCFEYMHALFLTLHLKVPNLLSQSVADWATCLALHALIRPHGEFSVPSVKKLQAVLRKKWPPNGSALKRKNLTDNYGAIVAFYNIAHLFGAKTQPIVIHNNDRAKIMQLLKLARSMLQRPVDFTQQQLYPLDRMNSVPKYADTPAGASNIRTGSTVRRETANNT